ncbi:MAG: hypothetical protein RSE54_04455, partial [Ruthenibacterium sp.]
MANQNDEKKESGAKAQTAENAAKPEGETTPVTEKKPAAKKSAAKSGAKKKPAAKKPAAPGSAAAKTSTAKSKAANGKNTARKKTTVSKGATGVKKSANAAQDFVRAEDAAQDAARKAEALPDTQDRVPAVETAVADELRQEDTAEAIGAMSAILEDTLSLQQAMTLDSPPFEADGKEGAQPEDLLEQMLKDKTVPEADADASSGEAAQENEASAQETQASAQETQAAAQETQAAAQETQASAQETQAAPASFMSRVRAWFAELAVDSIEPPKAVAAVAMQPVQTEEAAGNAKEDAQGAIKTEDAETDAQANVALAVDVTPEQEQEKDTKVVLPAEEPAPVAVELSPQPEKAQETEESTAAEQKALEAEEDAVLPKTESASVSEKEEPEQEAVPESEPEQAATSEKNAKNQAARKGTTGIFGSLKKLFQEAFAPIDELEEDEKENASIGD